MDKGSLGNRMKKYESISKNFLMRRTPVIVRLDGKAFHTFTRGFKKPFDEILIKTMQETMKYLCENIQGCVLGYTQSDEITLVLCDYQKLDTDAWFGYNVQKMVSVSASMATLIFNRQFEYNFHKWFEFLMECEDYKKYFDSYRKAISSGALFDSRAFSVPVNEVNNCLIWRQQDATRNSIQSLAQSLYSHKELKGINTKKLQDKMFTEKGVNWNDLPTAQKRGCCCIKTIVQNPNGDSKKSTCLRTKWIIDNEIPIFSQEPNYVNSRIIFEN